MRRLAVAVALSGIALAGAAAPSGPAGTATFKTWTAVCDNTARCAAFGFMGEDGDDSAYLRLDRDGGPNAAPRVRIVQTQTPAKAPVSLRVLGGPKRSADFGPYADRVTSADPAQGEVVVTPADAPRLTAALKDADSLALVAGGKPVASVPLAGAAAAVLWIDARQGRIGTVTALARPGSRPAAAVPPAPPLPVAVALHTTALRELKGKPPPRLMASRQAKDCHQAQDAMVGAEPDGYRLGPDLQLWLLPCGAGAYNLSSLVVLTDGHGGIRPAHLPRVPGEGAPDQADVLINAGFDPKTGVLSAFNKGRGISDCGESVSYAWEGRAFRLKSAETMPECHGVLPDDWPSLYRSR